jgi:L-fucose isomerase
VPALFNDPYDWDDAKEPTVFSCEADSDGALTMQIMKLISGKPVFFCDFRHFDEKDGVFVFCNCGAISTWYAERSDDPETNLKSVNLHPVIEKYAGKGCHVQFIAKEGEVTMGRLTRVLNKYKMSIIKGEIKRYSPEKLEETCPQWPHFFVKVSIDPNDLIDRYESNHIHGIAGDYVDELKEFCELKNIDYEVIT